MPAFDPMTHPLFLALSVALATLLSEDAALFGAAALVASGRWGLGPAFAATSLGIALGDLGLYGLGLGAGRLVQGWPWSRRWLGPQRLAEGRRWLEAGGPGLILACRFVPGARLTCYTAAGATRCAFWPFAAAVVCSTLLWVGLVLGLAQLGWAWCVAGAGVLVLLWFLPRADAWTWRARWAALGRWRHAEFWPGWLFYLPVGFHYLRLTLRYGHPLLPSLADPAIPGGGLINESKDLIYRSIPAGAHRLKTRLFQPGTTAQALTAWMKRSHLGFPIVAKPDQGQRGSGVRLLRRRADLEAYAGSAFPYLLQEYCGLGHESGVFYVRRPGQAKGFIYSLTDKRFPEVVGDGQRSLGALILAHPRLRLQAKLFFARHRKRLDEVLAKGRRLRLAQAGNHSQGTLFIDGQRLAGEGLRRSLDRLAKGMPDFHIGRFDLRYGDAGEFGRGRGYKIIEVNAGGAEATHCYDPALTLRERYRILFGQWDLLFELGAAQREKGLKPQSLWGLWRDIRAYGALSSSHPMAD
jgi:membrane protein DedA with SNARE-associated domain